MGKSTFEYFRDKFEDNLPKAKNYQEAFKKTNDEIGFEPYSSYTSFANVRTRKNKKGRD